MITLHCLYSMAGAMFAAFAVLSALDGRNPKRFGNAAFWGLMALSLLVVGGVGAGVSPQSESAAHDEVACEDAAFVFHGVQGAMKSEFAYLQGTQVQGTQVPLQVFDTVVIKGIPPEPENA